MMKTLVFIPTYYYLSHPVFFNIAKASHKSRNVYFNTKDPYFAPTNECIREEEICNYFDEYHEIDDTLFRDAVNAKCRLKKYRLFRSFKIKLEKQLKTLSPDAIVTTSDMGGIMNRMCNMWAERNNLPFIVVQPSFIDIDRVKNTFKEQLLYLLFNRILDIPLCTRQKIFGNERPKNYLFLWGEYFRNYYRGLEIEKNIHITGNPTFDPILKNEFDKTELDDLGLVLEGRPIITICTELVDEILGKENVREINHFYRFAIRENPDLHFVIKVHPREDSEKYEKIFHDLDKSNHTIVRNIDLHSLFRVTDVQVSVASYSSFEAIVFGIPVVLVNPGNRISFTDHFDNKIELRATAEEELSGHIRRSLTEEYKQEFRIKREKYLKSRLCSVDGKSGERVVKSIEEIILRHSMFERD